MFEILAVANEYCVDSGDGGVTPEALTPLVSSLRGVSLCSESLSYFHTTLCGFFSPVPRLDCSQLLEKDYVVYNTIILSNVARLSLRLFLRMGLEEGLSAHWSKWAVSLWTS